MSLLFLGVGNIHRGDDSVGPFLAQELAREGVLAARGVEVLPHSGEGVSLMQLWAGAKKVVIVDAMKSDGRRGTIRRFDAVREKLQTGVFRYSSHLFGLAEAVEMARQLGQLPQEMVIYGIEGKQFDFDTPMGPSVARAMRQVRAQVLKDFGGEA